MFNMHSCSICRNWFHYHCLSICGEKVPKRNHDFICPECTLPATIPWYNEIYKNTCTSDNILSILLLYFRQHPELISAIGSSPSELSLKAGIKMMLEGNLDQGKVVILDFVRSQLNFAMQNGKYDCFGSERGQFLPVFRHIWKLSASKKCDSPHCPSPLTYTCPTSFALRPPIDHFLKDQFSHEFPTVGHCSGYCGAEFCHDPPINAPFGVNDRLHVESNTRIQYMECRGNPSVTSAHFLSKNPWILPISIEQFKTNLDLLSELPQKVSIYSRCYEIGGYTVHERATRHFSAVIIWRGKEYYYDGLNDTNSRLQPLCAHQHLEGNKGSYAIYLLAAH